ncbi:GNAT family N-acetyltransferase [soil metagenome]
MKISLQEITADTVRAVTNLSVRDDQKQFVASNAVSLAQALFSPEAWYRAIHADDELAGFVMLYDESLRSTPPQEPGVGVWRLMVDAKFQGKGIGKAALQQVIEHVRAKGIFTRLQISYVPGPGCPEPLYRGLGFLPNGKIDDGEIVLELDLNETAA